MPTDLELAQAQLPGCAVVVALAHRAITESGQRATVERIMATTGLGKTAVYDARRELRRRWPDEYPPGAPQPNHPTDDSADADPPPMRKPAGQEVERRLDHAALIFPGTHIEPASSTGLTPWREALAAAVVPLDGRRSWDSYDIYSSAWDRLLELLPETADPTGAGLMGNLIALAIDFVERATGETVDRRRIALLIRQFGKAGLFGLSKAVGIADTDTDTYRYARAVAAGVVEQIRSEP